MRTLGSLAFFGARWLCILGLLSNSAVASAVQTDTPAVRDADGATVYRLDRRGHRLRSSLRTAAQAKAQSPQLTDVLSGVWPTLDSGWFEPYLTQATGSSPEAVAIGDLNGDGRQDVALTTSFYFDPENDYRLFVFLQDESGQLSAPVSYATRGTYTSPPASVAIGDVNEDGRADVVLGNDGASIEVYLQNAFGGLAPAIEYGTEYSTVLRIGDLNGDDRLDVVGIGWGGHAVGVFLQNPHGGLDAPRLYDAPHGGYDDLDVGDVNDDGLTDVVVMSGQGYAYDNLVVLLQNGAGTLDPAAFYDLGGNELTSGVAVGDVTGDGAGDVVVTYGGNRPDSMLGLFAQDSLGTLDKPISHASHDIPESVEIADINGDQRPDVVLLHSGWRALGVYLQDENGALRAEELYPLPYASHYHPQGLALGDINGDQHPDAVIADANNGLVILYNAASGLPSGPPFSDDLESGAMNWTIDGSDGMGGAALWHLSGHRFNSADTAFYYGRSDTSNYDTGARNAGSITSVPIDLAATSGATLSFHHFLRTENGSPYDTARVQISADQGLTWIDVYVTANSTTGSGFENITVDLSDYDGQVIQVRFTFDTGDHWYNQFEGWVVDDVTVAGS